VHFTIKHRYSGAELFAGDYDTLAQCVVAACNAGADLRWANLTGAKLREGVEVLALSKVCSRSDGYNFMLWRCADGVWRLTAGCRFFTMEQAWKHWTTTRVGEDLGEETLDILVLFEHHIERVDRKRRA